MGPSLTGVTSTDPTDEHSHWPEAIFGPPPWRVHDEDWDPDPMDTALGKFVRAIPVFEVMLMLTRDLVQPSSWVDIHWAGPGKAVTAVREGLSKFPHDDQHWLQFHLDQATRVLDLRQAIMHGIWTNVDPELGLYVSERPLSRKDAKQLTGEARLPDDDHPTHRREFNHHGVMAGWARARSVSRYLSRHQDRWEAHIRDDEDPSGIP